jgi:hypothetical protein
MSEASAPTESESIPQGDLVARAGTWYRNARYILTAAMFCYGLWNINDGFFKWPHENLLAKIQGYDKPPHSDADLLFNDVLGIVLPPGSLLLLAWALRNSRGEISLIGRMLSVPGHRPIPLEKIESVDKQKWERKGIAVVTYRLDSGETGKFKLDDFVYERVPIDQIFARIEQALKEPRAEKVTTAPPQAPPQAPPPPSSPTVAAVPRAKFPPTPPRPRLGR